MERRRTTSLGLAVLSVMVGVMAVAVLLWAAGSAGASPPMGPLAQGGAPLLLNYQGRLADPATSLPKPDGPYTITFKIYDAETDGSLIWSEAQVVTVTRGLFNVLLGSSTALSASDFDGTSRWLELEVEGETLSPRMRFGSVPYAIQAEEAKNAWRLTGNAGTSPTTNFLGTTDAVSLTLVVNNTAALRLEPNADSPNLIGGYSGNWVADGVVGAFIGGGGKSGLANRVTDDYGTVGGGWGNQAGDDAGTTLDRRWGTVGGGLWNTAIGEYATVSGGYDNEADGAYATVGGGQHNIAHGDGATVGGGGWYKQESPPLPPFYYPNLASGDYATISGGQGNTANGQHATIGGGFKHAATASYTTVGGGERNTASGSWATVGGGVNNRASGYYATVGGGSSNTAVGERATVPGGRSNTAQGAHSFAAGRRAKANNEGCFVWGDSYDGDVECNNNDRWVARASGGVYFYTSSDLSTGVYLAAGSETWQQVSASDRNLKDNFAPVDGQEILARLAKIPIATWNYRAGAPSVRHMSPTAQDFYATFGLGEDDRHLSALDTNGVALAAIQALYAQNQALEAENATLQAENAAQQQQLDDLEARLAALEVASANSTGSAQPLPSGLLPGAGVLLAGLGLVWVNRRGGALSDALSLSKGQTKGGRR